MDDRRRAGDLALEQKVIDLAIAVVGLHGAIEGVGAILNKDVENLREEINTQRKLAKYARRTWFEVMAWIFLAGLVVSDVGRTYCLPRQGETTTRYPEICDTVFWATNHHGHWSWRVLGLLATVSLLLWMAKRSQVPSEIYIRTPTAADKPDDHLTWYHRWVQKRRRS